MIEKVRTALWFAKRPTYWEHAVALASRKLKPDRDAAEQRSAAGAWAASQAGSHEEALRSLGFGGEVPALDESLLKEGKGLASQVPIKMGGPGDTRLLYALTRLLKARRVIETGVAYGWSSLAILAALEEDDDSKLVSVDMPYPKRGNDAYVGAVVPERLRKHWTLLRQPDRRGIEKGIKLLGGTVDLAHYDSDKSWYGRAYAFPMLWDALRPGGILISDDIQDNFYFKEFVESCGMPFAICECEKKYVGVIQKL